MPDGAEEAVRRIEQASVQAATTLDLSSCGLTSLPDSLRPLTNLTALNLTGNRLRRLPDWLAGFADLTNLRLRGNALGRLPSSLAELSNLTVLDVADNRLETLPEAARHLTRLTTLNLSGNELWTLPDWMAELTKLTVLNLANNRLETVPDAARHLTNLASLNVSGNALEWLPDWLAELTNLTTLDLGGNEIGQLPDAVRSLVNLDSLEMPATGLWRLPDWLAELGNLSVLNLANNRLETVPDAARHLTNLTTLNLGGNELRSPPDWLTELTNLTALNLGGNMLETMPDAARSLTNLTTLDLAECGLWRLPDWLAELGNLSVLNLANNRLETVPDAARHLTNLTTLNLGGNVLETVPEAVRSLTNLNTLDLGGNELARLPDWLAELKNLTTLNLSGNTLGWLPRSLAELTNLAVLNLSGNALESLPDWLAELTNLAVLNLSGNALGTLPDAVRSLTNLTVLRLARCGLWRLPDWLAELTSLTTLDLGGNEILRDPPPEIVAGGTRSVMAFLQAIRDVGTTRLWRSKLLLVGQGRAGKTTLVRALDGRGFDAAQLSTAGLELTSLSLEKPDPLSDRLVVSELTMDHPEVPAIPQVPRTEMQLSVWDFGGQEIYHATHQFFLTGRSLFLVVWDPNQGYDNSRLPYWLNTVTARAPGAPILLVATHGAQRPADLPLAELRHRFPAIVDAITVDSATDQGIEQLRVAIAHYAATLPLMGAPWPASWAAGADALYELPGTHTAVPVVRELLAKNAVTQSDQDELLSALTVLGDVLHYPDDPQLGDIVVLQPEWLNTRIARILDSHAVAERGGQLLWEDVNTEWADIEPAMREHFLTMMDRYDISYRIHERDAPVASLVTALLPWQRPDLSSHWPEHYTGRQIGLSYKLSLIPPGIPTWFITRTRRFTVEHWRTGALLRDPDTGTLALVEANPEAGTLHLAARGQSLERFLPVLLGELAHSLGRYPGLSTNRAIACPCTVGPPRCPHYYDYTHLLRARQHGDTAMTCPETYRNVEIVPLLAGTSPTPSELDRVGIIGGLDEITTALKSLGFDLGQLKGMTYQIKATTEVLHTAAYEAVGTRCPSVFTVRRITSGPLRTRYELRVCCEYEGGWHEIASEHPGEADAAYDLRILHDWAQKIAPTAQAVAATAKTVVPLISLLLSGIAMDLNGAAKTDLLKARSHLPKIPGHLALLDQTPGFGVIHEVTTPTSFASTDADYRELHVLFAALDADRSTHRRWGGLSAALDAHGHTIYLCSQHASRRYGSANSNSHHRHRIR